ncbi:hypothetical protein HD553DRAFT_350794 [Filobasidium floriforme]|uniref:uncharacterized protein n=1 Tax=Filobasidium floriforme TaxID=5210 RepID=UPI001E8EDC32|nr:uncharacterized protein HD553DRAFT_350794 [Filobasidium floriforme]KAH8083137.1 hypothetical protein HD553DRAFT_350794 [Filobasidium floriforme]
MIVRIRSPQGLTRNEVEEDSRWNQVLRSHHIRYPTKGTALTLRRHGDTNKIDLLSSVENGKTLAEQGVRHGDLFYLEPSRSVTKSFEETILVSPPLSPVSADSSVAISGWSHAEIYSRIRRMLMSSKTRG